MLPPDTEHLHLLFLLSWMLFPSLFTGYLSSWVTSLGKSSTFPWPRLKHTMRRSHSVQCIPLLHSTGHSCDFVLIWSCNWCLSPSLNHTAYKTALLFLLITVSISLAESWCSINTCQISPEAVQGKTKEGWWVSLEEETSGCSNKLVILRALHHTFEKRSWELGIEVTFWWWKSRHGMRPPTGRTS